jgi:hypothetical protein
MSYTIFRFVNSLVQKSARAARLGVSETPSVRCTIVQTVLATPSSEEFSAPSFSCSAAVHVRRSWQQFIREQLVIFVKCVYVMLHYSSEASS